MLLLLRKSICKNVIFAEFKTAKRGVKMKFDAKPDLVSYCEGLFNLPKHQVQSMMLLHPPLQTLEKEQFATGLTALGAFLISPQQVAERPAVLGFHHITIHNRLCVLKECGFKQLNLQTLSKYITNIKKRKISELMYRELIPEDDDLWQRLSQCFSDWPDIKDKLNRAQPVSPVANLYTVRMEVLQKFLKLTVGMPESKFQDTINTYKMIRHKPLSNISRALRFVLHELEIPRDKIVSHGFVFHLEPDNLEKMLSEVKQLGGRDIREVLKKFPAIMRSNYESLLKIQQICRDEGISEEVQRRSYWVFTLSPNTVAARIKEIKEFSKLKGLQDNTRALELVYYKSKVYQRLDHLQYLNKKCSSLHKLISSTKEYERYVKQFGDKTKGVDIVNALSIVCKDVGVPLDAVKDALLRHRFWTYSSLTSIMSVLDYLSSIFTTAHVMEHCQILLYPMLNVQYYVEQVLRISERAEYSVAREYTKTQSTVHQNMPSIYSLNVNSSQNTGIQVKNSNTVQDVENRIFVSDKDGRTQLSDSFLLYGDLKSVDNGQLLSLVLYMLEKEYHFSGEGVWIKQPVEVKTVAPQETTIKAQESTA